MVNLAYGPWLIRNCGETRKPNGAGTLGAMCQVALVGYAVGGAFLSLAYFDLPYDILIIAVLAKRWAWRQKSEQKNARLMPHWMAFLPGKVRRSS